MLGYAKIKRVKLKDKENEKDIYHSIANIYKQYYIICTK